jgi:hypothetical protein
MVRIPTDSQTVIDVYHRAADENRNDHLLDGATLYLPDYGQVVMTGDMHGHLGNFDKLVKYCMLGAAKARHVIMHEMIHQELVGLDDVDMSHELLYEAAHWKCAFPDQVHFLQSNHELAQLTGQEITKNSRFVLKEFEEGVAKSFGRNHVTKMVEAIQEFIGSMPLAARTHHGIFMSHSLPSIMDWHEFDPTVLDKSLSAKDVIENISIYHMVWGRRHTPELLDEMCRVLKAKLFIVGHQPQEEGFSVVAERMLIMASDHSHGVFLPIDLNRKSYTMDELLTSLKRYVSVP